MSARAFAKVLLFGEHSVVHGRTAIAAALDRGAVAEARVVEGESTLELAPWGVVARATGDDDLSRAFRALLDAIAPRTTISASVDIEVPGGAGLGCSAAMGVALARAIADAVGRAIDDDEAAAYATSWERVFHGNPSGVDVAVASRGGVIAFKRATAGANASELGRKPAEICPIVLRESMEIVVGSTGEPSSTRAMVEQVARQLARRPQVVERTFDGIDALAIAGAKAIEAARWYEVGRLMDLNHALLASLMVSTTALERACDVARKAGAFGAKLTGGGGGGCAIALAPDRSSEVLEAWKREGIEGFAAPIAAGRVAKQTTARGVVQVVGGPPSGDHE